MTTQTQIRPVLKTHLFKACIRCGGDLVLERDSAFDRLTGGPDYVCLQCGRTMPVQALTLSSATAGAVPAEAA